MKTITLNQLLESIDWNQLARHILLEKEMNKQVCIFSDGTITVLDQNEYFSNAKDHVATIHTPGINNLDLSFFTDNFCTWNEDRVGYIVTGKYQEDRGRFIGSIENVIEECIVDGDISVFINDWYESIADQFEEWKIQYER